MFNSKKQSYSRKIRSITTNEYNEQIESYTTADNIKMFISLSTESETNSNDMRIQECTHVGLTKDIVTKGDLIADKYKVTFVNGAGAENIVYMREIENNGCFN